MITDYGGAYQKSVLTACFCRQNSGTEIQWLTVLQSLPEKNAQRSKPQPKSAKLALNTHLYLYHHNIYNNKNLSLSIVIFN
jgi:hypothetical protein